MEIVQEQPPLHPLQLEANEYYYGWALDHEKDPKKGGGKITAIEFDPVTYPEQRLENALVEIDPSYSLAPPQVVLDRLRASMGQAMRSEATADKLISELKERSASSSDSQSLPESIKSALARGESIGVLFGHQILMDIGYGIAALTVAQQTTDYMDRNLVVLNKTMAFEKFEGIPFSWLSRPFSNAVFVSPRTASSEARQIPDHISKAINNPAGRVIRDFAKKGAMFAVALHGTGLKMDEAGRLVMPKPVPASAGLVRNCDHLLRMAFYQHPETRELSWNIGPLQELKPPEDRQKRRSYYQEIAERAQYELAQQLADLSGTEVIYKHSQNRNALGAAALVH